MPLDVIIIAVVMIAIMRSIIRPAPLPPRRRTYRQFPRWIDDSWDEERRRQREDDYWDEQRRREEEEHARRQEEDWQELR
jgi:hypothetical protein